MLKHPWLVDVLVWAVMSVVFVVAALGVLEATRPPTAAEYRARQEAQISQQCFASSSVKSMPQQMQKSYCGCIVNESFRLGGADEDDAQRCQNRASLLMKDDPELPAKFAVAYPPICRDYAAFLAGANARGSAQYCQCMQGYVDDNNTRMAGYVYAGREADGDARAQNNQSCNWALEFGKGWKEANIDGALGVTLTIDLPIFNKSGLPETIGFICNAGVPAFISYRYQDVAFDDAIAFADTAGSDLGGISKGETLSPAAAFGIFRRFLNFAEYYEANPDSISEVTLQTLTSSAVITLTDFVSASRKFAAACQETLPSVPASSAPVASSAPDYWEEYTPDMVLLKYGQLDWYGVLSCDGETPPYLEISGAQVEAGILKKYPDAGTGGFQAEDITVTGYVDGQRAFSGTGICADGVDTQGVACFVTLTKDKANALAKGGGLSWDVNGSSTQSGAFGASAAVRELLPRCLATAQ